MHSLIKQFAEWLYLKTHQDEANQPLRFTGGVLGPLRRGGANHEWNTPDFNEFLQHAAEHKRSMVWLLFEAPDGRKVGMAVGRVALDDHWFLTNGTMGTSAIEILPSVESIPRKEIMQLRIQREQANTQPAT